MNMTETITVKNHDQAIVEIEPGAIEQKNSAIQIASDIFAVESASDQATATKAIQQISTLLKKAESSRKLIKAELEKPVKKLDEVAKAFCLELINERDRLSKLVNEFQAEQQRIALQAERDRLEQIRKQQAEQYRLMVEAQEAKRKASQIEAEFEGKKAEELAKDEAAQKQQELIKQQALLASVQSAPKVEAPKASGMVVSEVSKFEVTDIHALYVAWPSLVRMEPNTIEINNRIRSGMKECPGLRIWKETKTTFRT